MCMVSAISRSSQLIGTRRFAIPLTFILSPWKGARRIKTGSLPYTAHSPRSPLPQKERRIQRPPDLSHLCGREQGFQGDLNVLFLYDLGCVEDLDLQRLALSRKVHNDTLRNVSGVGYLPLPQLNDHHIRIRRVLDLHKLLLPGNIVSLRDNTPSPP